VAMKLYLVRVLRAAQGKTSMDDKEKTNLEYIVERETDTMERGGASDARSGLWKKWRSLYEQKESSRETSGQGLFRQETPSVKRNPANTREQLGPRHSPGGCKLHREHG